MEAAGGRNTLSKTTLSKNEFRLFLKKSCVIYRDAPLSKIPTIEELRAVRNNIQKFGSYLCHGH